MASPTQWTWVWVNSGSWWWTRRPGVLWFMGSQRVGHNWATELNWNFRTLILFQMFKDIRSIAGGWGERTFGFRLTFLDLLSEMQKKPIGTWKSLRRRTRNEVMRCRGQSLASPVSKAPGRSPPGTVMPVRIMYTTHVTPKYKTYASRWLIGAKKLSSHISLRETGGDTLRTGIHMQSEKWNQDRANALSKLWSKPACRPSQPVLNALCKLLNPTVCMESLRLSLGNHHLFQTMLFVVL